MALTVDNRRIDILATGLSFHNARPLFCDATVRSPLRGNGEAYPTAAQVDGAVLKRAEQSKKDKYSDIEAGSMAELLTLGVEVGGRWNDTALTLVRHLARYKVEHVSPLLRRSVQLAWQDRWWAML